MHTFASLPVLILACLAAVAFDLRHRRVPNILSIGILFAGLALRVPYGWESVQWGLLAFGAAFLLGFAFYLLGGLGGGDVKLMAALAVFLDSEGLLIGFLVMAGVGALMALISVGRAGRLRETGTNLAFFFSTFGKQSFSGWKGESPMVSLANGGVGVVTNPYAVAICLGALSGWIAPHLGWSL